MTKQLHLESAVGIYFRRGQTESFKAFMPMETLHPEKKWGRRRRLCEAKCLTPAPQKEMGTPKAALRSKVLDPCTPKRNGDAEGGFAKQSA